MTQILLKVMEDKGNWPPGEQSTWDRGLIGSNPNGLVALEAVILSLGSQWSHLEGDSSKNSDVQTISQTHWIRSLGIGPRHQCFISISRELPLSLLRSDWINILSLPSVSNIKKKKQKTLALGLPMMLHCAQWSSAGSAHSGAHDHLLQHCLALWILSHHHPKCCPSTRTVVCHKSVLDFYQMLPHLQESNSLHQAW